jgi:hypothetical protein
MPKFRKKQVIIEAVQFNGNDSECRAFCPIATDHPYIKPSLIIPTLEGNHLCSLGDWIVKGVEGEFYPVKDSIFRKTYEPVESDQ